MAVDLRHFTASAAVSLLREVGCEVDVIQRRCQAEGLSAFMPKDVTSVMVR